MIRTKSKAVEEPEAPEAKRYTIREALEEAGRRRDERMGRPAKETKAGAAERAAAVADAGADAIQDQYTDLSYPELQATAKGRDLNAGGSADQLRARLREADASNTPAEAGDDAGVDEQGN
jgi:hypothetical protein